MNTPIKNYLLQSSNAAAITQAMLSALATQHGHPTNEMLFVNGKLHQRFKKDDGTCAGWHLVSAVLTG